MNFQNYSVQFVQKARDAGYSSEIVFRCLKYAEPLLNRNLPVIYNATHLAGLVGYEKQYLARAVVFTPFFYRYFNIKKHNGKDRIISVPLPSLKEIQSWILNNILYKAPVSKFAKAYIPKTTLKQNLVFHKNQPIVLNLDITDFFGNIRRPRIEKVFKQLGYSFAVSNLLSKLCCLHECLPQGAPPSPYLSNLVMCDFDDAVSEYCLNHKIRYSRYADDLCFSGDFDYLKLIDIVKQELKKISLTLNLSKTRLMKQNQRQVVTGIVVNKKLQVSREKRKKIRQAVYFIKTYGLENHMEKINCTKSNYLSHLFGQILHILFINPDDKEFQEYKNYLSTLRAINE